MIIDLPFIVKIDSFALIRCNNNIINQFLTSKLSPTS
jgi:hypothetical protein